MSEKINLTEEYWDCECEKNYIHYKTKIWCPICKKQIEEQPPSRVNEVVEQGFISAKETNSEVTNGY
jgi:hypothetical protein